MARRSRRAPLTALALAAVVAAGVGPAAAQSADPPELVAARNDLAAARSRAQRAAQEYLAVQQELGRIEARIDEVQAQIPPLVATVAELRRVLRERAAQAYRNAAVTSVAAFELFEVDSLLDAARLTRIAAAANRRTDEISGAVVQLAKALRARQEELADQRAAQQELVATAERSAAELDRAMADAARNLRTVEHDVAVRTWFAALVADAQAETPTTTPPPPEEVSVRPPPADPSLAELVPVEDLLCPVDGPVTFFNDWGQPRSNWRVHEGTDIFAARGTPNVAVADGVAKRRVGGLGGNAVWLEADHGVSYYYAHFDDFEGSFDGPEQSRRVTQGEVIGYTGSTGNAAGGPAHTHFEVHPADGGAINPYRILLVACAEQLGTDTG